MHQRTEGVMYKTHRSWLEGALTGQIWDSVSSALKIIHILLNLIYSFPSLSLNLSFSLQPYFSMFICSSVCSFNSTENYISDCLITNSTDPSQSSTDSTLQSLNNPLPSHSTLSSPLPRRNKQSISSFMTYLRQAEKEPKTMREKTQVEEGLGYMCQWTHFLHLVIFRA